MSRVAYLGPERTNTHAAAQARFGRRSRYVHAPTVEDVFHLVERRQVDFGVVPIENSLGGAVTHTLDRFVDFVDTPVRIHGEIEQPVRHCLILQTGARPQAVSVVYSHPQALAQCDRWLQRHVPTASRWETSSTAEAVEYVLGLRGRANSPPRRERAAIAVRELATRGLTAVPIPEDHENRTRFLILSLEEPPRGRRNKTAVLFALKDTPGALHDALVPFKRQGINLTKIESRPSRQRVWEYLFFIDFEGHESESRVKRALEQLRRSTSLLRVLGSYPISSRQQ